MADYNIAHRVMNGMKKQQRNTKVGCHETPVEGAVPGLEGFLCHRDVCRFRLQSIDLFGASLQLALGVGLLSLDS